MCTKSLTPVAFLLSGICVAGGASPTFAAGGECLRIDLPLETVETVSATQAGGDLVVLDYRAERLIVVDLEHGNWSALGGWAGEELKGRRPVAVRAAAGGGVLLEQASPAQLVRLDENLGIQPGLRHVVNGVRGGDGLILDSMWTWEMVDGDVVACGDLVFADGDRTSLGSWQTGFVRFPIGAAGDFRPLLTLSIDDRTALGCRLAMPLIASIGNRVYILELGDTPRILVSSPDQPKPRPLRAFPERFATVPSLPTVPGPDAEAFIFQVFEESTMPAGLFGWEGQLYLLSRSPAADRNGTDWWLTRIDPQTDGVVGTVKIASRAPHLMVVPGADRWALIEKGHVGAYGAHDLESVLVVPVSTLRNWDPERPICGTAG